LAVAAGGLAVVALEHLGSLLGHTSLSWLCSS